MIIILLVFLILVFVLLPILIYISNNCLKVKKYNIKSKKIPRTFNDYKIVHISDVHSKLFGENNKDLIEKVKNINPDIIVMTGDIISDEEEDVIKFIDYFRELYQTYPTYYAIGNHERGLGYTKYKLYIDSLIKNGVNVIKNGFIPIEKNGEKIVINALKYRESMRLKHLTQEKKETFIKDMKKKLDKLDVNNYNILLTHDPENFEMYEKLGVDLIFSGHVHGGLIRIGKICLLSPRRKFFPKYGYGKYRINNTNLIVSSGIGNASIPIRLFNRPEIVVVNLKREVLS